MTDTSQGHQGQGTGVSPELKSFFQECINNKAVAPIMSSLFEQKSLLLSHSAKLEVLTQSNENFKRQLGALDDRVKVIESLKADVEALRGKAERAESVMEELQQYGRRNGLRISNVPLGDIAVVKRGSKDVKDTLSYALNLFSTRLHIEVSPNAVSRSHIVGKINKEKGTCQILIKFVRYSTRDLIYRAKSKLKSFNNEDMSSIFICEDLTATRFTIIQGLFRFHKAGKVHSYWTQDGRIYYLLKGSDVVYSVQNYIVSCADVDQLLLSPQAARRSP